MKTSDANLFAKQLQSQPLKRLSLTELRRCFFQYYPDLLNHPERNNFLLLTLNELVDAKIIAYPSSSKRNWDTSSTPKLPNWVNVNVDVKPPPIVPYTIAWVRELSFCTKLTHRTQIEAAIKINDYLIHHRALLAEILPVRERSFEIFGDEKRLDSLVKDGTLFGGRLTLADIGAVVVYTPIAFEAAGPIRKKILVVENHNTYWSICKWNREEGRYSAIVWGGGNAVLKNIDSIAHLSDECESPSIDYFGDIDLRGMEILAALQKRMKEQHGMQIDPAIPFYEWLLQHANPVNLSNKSPLPDTKAFKLESMIAVEFSGKCRDKLISLLMKAQRIPQEALNSRQLKSFTFKQKS